MVSRRIDFCVLLVYTVSERFFRLRRSTAAFYTNGVIAFFFFFFEDDMRNKANRAIEQLNDLIQNDAVLNQNYALRIAVGRVYQLNKLANMDN